MDWQLILTILVPTFAFLGWIYNRIDKKFDCVDKKFEGVYQRFDMVFDELKQLRKDMQVLDSRISRIEGQLTGVPSWEPKIRERKQE